MTKPIAMESEARADRFYWPQLDGLRFLAFFLVFLNHMPLAPSLKLAELPETAKLLMMTTGIAGVWGWVGVELFFVLSAFLITSILLNERDKFGVISFKSFMARRMLRIWPLYYFMGFLGFVVFPGILLLQHEPFGWQGLWQQHLLPYLTFLFNFSLPTQAELPMHVRIAWSVAMEEQFYLIWGFTLWRVQKQKTLWLILALALPATMLIRYSLFIQSTNHQIYYYNTFAHLDPILIGISIALLWRYHHDKLLQIQRWTWLMAIAPVVFYCYLMFAVKPIYFHYDRFMVIFPLISLSCGSLLLACLLSKNVAAFFSFSLFAWAGRLTYGAYFLHCLALSIVGAALPLLLPALAQTHPYWLWLLNCLGSLGLTFVFAWTSWHLLEKHFYRLRKRFEIIPTGFQG